MTIGYPDQRQAASLRNATVTAYSGGRATLSIDGGTVTNVPVYGPAPAVNAKVLVLEQGGTLLVLGNAVSLQDQIDELRGVVEEFIDLMQGWLRRAE